MPARNIKVMSQDELDYLNSIYTFDIEEDIIGVLCKGRLTFHNKNGPFTILTAVRKITISIEAINYWIEQKDKTGYSLFDIQNTMNLLKVIYQEVNFDSVMNYLKNGINTIITV